MNLVWVCYGTSVTLCRSLGTCILKCVCVSFSLSASLTAFLLTGQSGLGKSTLMNTLFKSKVSRKSVLATAQEKIPKTIEIKSISHGMELLNPANLPCASSVFCLSLSVGLSAKIHSFHTTSFSYLMYLRLQTFTVPSSFILSTPSFL